MRLALTAVACLAAGTVAGKDLPRPKAEEPKRPDPAEQACAYLGQGYTRVAGSDTCVKVSGSVRFEGQARWNR